MPGGRPKGIKNSKGHTGGGDRKSQKYKMQKLQQHSKATSFFRNKVLQNKKKIYRSKVCHCVLYFSQLRVELSLSQLIM